MSEEFYRIKRLPPYVFAEVNRLKAACRAEGMDIIDFGMGNPDMDTPAHIVDKLIETVRKPRTHRYSASKGIPGLRRAQAAYYERRFGVKLDPETQVVATLGSKEGLANLAMAITAPGDVILTPNPSYPIHPYGFMIAGGALRHIPALHEGRFDPEAYLRAAEHAVRHSVPKPSALVVNFPSNPTAQLCDLDFYAELVALARRHGVWVLSDLAYAEIYFDGPPPPSILQVPGAMECAVEFTSLSKTYSMPGWRMGFAVGNERLIAALTRIKSYLDYGAFTPVQVAAAAALNGPQDCVEQIRGVYRARRDALVQAMGRAGWDIPPPPATMFAWAPVPEPFRALGSMEFSKILLREAGVAVAPGVGFGEYGEGYVRLGLVENEQRIRQAARGVRRLLQNADAALERHAEARAREEAGA
ncbi:LL-diaminopimelate aminotransferase [Oceanicella actignis]|uniref:Aminotransferase n=1 Tax=Oceanicella actignis TaxID=1189325 RepID=A0A1M7SQ28_9RHOB|nr:LL-diaminopimelate aminotransferase [Oceanicella actignis]TYO90821.1 alanine-synthesizing transaminase [Oceanicella actignis]SES66619.1 alanine-synthesizing transaminase [Oceanicella actignis]SHN60647.1 alanine-synthesizing transaminase [Oceanicella actignis]